MTSAELSCVEVRRQELDDAPGRRERGGEGEINMSHLPRRRYPPRSLIPSSSGPLNYIFISIAHST